MKKVCYFFIFVFIFSFQSFSQIENIKQSAKSIGVGREPRINSGGDGSMLFLFYFLFRDITISSIDMLVNHHRFLLDNKDVYSEAFSVDYLPTFSLNQKNQFNMMQRIRGTYGVLSTDIRLNYLVEFSHLSAQSYKTVDWQILQFSTYPGPNFNIRFGTGLLYDNYSLLSYNEHSLGLEFYLLQHQYWFTIEGRFAFDYFRGADIYKEFNFKGSYNFFQAQYINAYGTAGILYQNYYSAAEISSFQFGLSVNLH
jgi:hypothetical protein